MAAGEEQPYEKPPTRGELLAAIELAYIAFYTTLRKALDNKDQKLDATFRGDIIGAWDEIANLSNLYIVHYFKKDKKAIMSCKFQQVYYHLFVDSPVEGIHVPGYPGLVFQDARGPIFKEFSQKFYADCNKAASSEDIEELTFWSIMGGKDSYHQRNTSSVFRRIFLRFNDTRKSSIILF